MNNFFAHWGTVRTHRKWVRKYCFKAKLYWQGLTHDLSKYSPTEFLESVRHYQGNRSPIDACKEKNGFSKAWQHHRGRNKHHRESWTDHYDKGTSCVPMPYKYAAEMLCDYLGAGRAYMGAAFSYVAELNWWNAQLEKNICIHPQTAKFITLVLTELAYSTFFVDEIQIFRSLPFLYYKAEELRNEDGLSYPYVYYGRSLDFKDML